MDKNSVIGLSMSFTFFLVWYQFGLGWAIGVVLSFVAVCIWLSYLATKQEVENIIIIHPDVRQMMEEEKQKVSFGINPKQYNAMMDHFMQEYMESRHRVITQEELSEKLRSRVMERHNDQVNLFKEKQEIAKLERWLKLEFPKEENSSEEED